MATRKAAAVVEEPPATEQPKAVAKKPLSQSQLRNLQSVIKSDFAAAASGIRNEVATWKTAQTEAAIASHKDAEQEAEQIAAEALTQSRAQIEG